MDNDLDIEALFHISTIPEDELLHQYVDLSCIVSMTGFGGYFMGVDNGILREEVTSTLSIEKTREELMRKLLFHGWQITSSNGSNGIELAMVYADSGMNREIIKEAMLACGWTFSKVKPFSVGNLNWVAMSFDPMFQKNVSSEAFSFSHLYHWAPYSALNSVLRYGLKPKSENSVYSYPNRLHLIRGDAPIDELLNLGRQLWRANTNKINDGRYVLLSISTNGIPSDTEFFHDPRYDWGYYIKKDISPENISVLLGQNFQTGERF